MAFYAVYVSQNPWYFSFLLIYQLKSKNLSIPEDEDLMVDQWLDSSKNYLQFHQNYEISYGSIYEFSATEKICIQSKRSIKSKFKNQVNPELSQTGKRSTNRESLMELGRLSRL